MKGILLLIYDKNTHTKKNTHFKSLSTIQCRIVSYLQKVFEIYLRLLNILFWLCVLSSCITFVNTFWVTSLFTVTPFCFQEIFPIASEASTPFGWRKVCSRLKAAQNQKLIWQMECEKRRWRLSTVFCFRGKGREVKVSRGIERYVDDCQLIAIAKAFVCSEYFIFLIKKLWIKDNVILVHM